MVTEDSAGYAAPQGPPTTGYEALLSLARVQFATRDAEMTRTQDLCVRVRNEVADHAAFIGGQARNWAKDHVLPDVEEAQDLRGIYRTVEGLNASASDDQMTDALRAIDASGALADRLEAHAASVENTLAKLEDPLGALHDLQRKWPTLRKRY